MTRSRAVALLALALLVAGCAASRVMTNMWNDTAYSERPVRRVLVLATRHDEARRRMWEDAFANDLSAHGIEATPSYRIFQTLPDTQQVIQEVGARGYDAVLI